MSTPQARAADSGVALVRRYYAAFNSADWPAMLDCLDDNVAHDINQGGREIGKAAFREFLARMKRCYREQLTDITIIASDDGRRASAEFVVRGEYLSSDEGLPPAHGQQYTLPAGAFFDIDGGRITRVSNYYNLPEWVRQVSA